MNKKFKINRRITQKECPCMEEPLEAGTVVFEYLGYTYGCISQSGIPCTIAPDKTPFFEIPANALSEI